MKNSFTSSSFWILLLFAPNCCYAQEATRTRTVNVPVGVTTSETTSEVPNKWGDEGKHPTSTSSSNTEPLVDSAPVDENKCFTPQEVLKQCLKSEMRNEAINDCLGCDQVPAAVSKEMVKKQISLEEHNKQVCEMLIDGGVCQQLCGVCFHAKQKVAACEWGCELSPVLEGQEQPERPFDTMPQGDEALTEPIPSLADAAFLSNFENVAPQCQDALDTVNQCVAEDNTHAILDECMKCHEVKDLSGQLASGSFSLADLHKSMCKEKPECESSCGECYPEVKKFTACALGCDGSGFPPISLPDSIENIPFLGGGGFPEEHPPEVDFPRDCEDSMPAIKECIAENMPDQSNVLTDCMKCHNEVVGLAGQEELDPMMVKEKLCEQRPGCESICGPCYLEIHRMATCSLGCGSNAVHDVPAFSFPGTENTHGNDDIGKANDATELIAETTQQEDNTHIIAEKGNGLSNEVDEDMGETTEGSSGNENELGHENHENEQEYEYNNVHESENNFGSMYETPQQVYKDKNHLDKVSDHDQDHENENDYHNGAVGEILPNVDGFNLQCQNAMEEAMECLASHQENQTNRLDDCLIYHESQAEEEAFAAKDATVACNQPLVCRERTDCESVCGECYPEIHKYAMCSIGCDREERPEQSSFPEKEDNHEAVEHGFTGGRPSNHEDRRQCKSILPAIEECIFANMTDQANVLEECMKCHNTTTDVQGQIISSVDSFDEAVCVEQPDCKISCGICYPVIFQYISCSAGCHDEIQREFLDIAPNSDSHDSNHSFLPNLDGSEMQCQDDMEVALECVYSYQEDTTQLLDECLKCHDVPAFEREFVTDNATLSNVDASMCADRPDCKSVCGECYQEIHKFATCSVGCSLEERPERPSLPTNENNNGSDEQSFIVGRPSKHHGQHQCESILPAVEECIATNMTDQADVLEECMKCHNATIDSNDELCAERPDCDSVCGACYEVIHEFATCSLGCDGDNVPELSSHEHNASKTHHEKDEKDGREDHHDHKDDILKGRGKPEHGKRRPFTAKYEQQVSVRLEGCTKLLNETEQEEYVNITENFLRKRDSSVQIEFVGQRLVERRSKKKKNNGKVRRYRMLQETSVEVDTRVGSSSNKKPGDMAIELIENDDKGFVEALQAEDTSSTFESVGAVQAQPAIETAKPTPAPLITDVDDDADDSKNDTIMLWIGLGLLIVSLLAAVFYSAKLLNLLVGTSGKEYNKSSEQSLLTRESGRMDIGFDKDIFSRNFD